MTSYLRRALYYDISGLTKPSRTRTLSPSVYLVQCPHAKVDGSAFQTPRNQISDVNPTCVTQECGHFSQNQPIVVPDFLRVSLASNSTQESGLGNVQSIYRNRAKHEYTLS